MLYKNFRGNFVVNLFGKWSESEDGGHSNPVGGFVYYISPPKGLGDLFVDPLHCLVYTIFILGTCALFSKTWIEVSGSSVRDVAK
jgi:protein transport protein SEC61 subunit alpha